LRLSAKQRNDIRKSVEGILGHSLIEIYLYGSRTNDNLRGGDIDLLVICKEKTVNIYQLINEIKKTPSLGDQRIDITVATTNELSSDPFLKSIQDTLAVI